MALSEDVGEVFQVINGVLVHRRDRLGFTPVQTIQQQERQHNHERQNFRHPISVLFDESRLPNDSLQVPITSNIMVWIDLGNFFT